MYEQFGSHDVNGKIEFKVFFPGGPEVKRGDDPKIISLKVYGSFQQNLTGAPWDYTTAVSMSPTPFNSGTLYSCLTPALPQGFYEYKYIVEFENGERRIVGDPCARYGGDDKFENAGVVVGGSTPQQNKVQPLAKRLPLGDLVIYELHADDFTIENRANLTPIDALTSRLDYIADLGFNAIEPLPWTAWSTGNFSWGYNPFMYFSVENRYVNNPAEPAEKLSRLKRFITRCHQLGIHVIMDGVFNHVEKIMRDRGFAYCWLYQDIADCPFVGIYGDHGYFEDLDFANPCTQEFILDVCVYWIDLFGIDGFRLDYTKGFYDPGQKNNGLPKLISDINSHLTTTGQQNFSIVIEHLDGYGAIDVTNKVNATGCWYDDFYWRSRDYLKDYYIDGRIMRLLDAARDFDQSRSPVTYIENHDHAETASNAGGRGQWYRTQPHAIALFTVSGTPLIYSGQEFGEDYWMPEGYEETETIKRVVPRPKQWATLGSDGTAAFMRWFYRRLNSIRRDHPALRSPNFYPSYWLDDWERFRDGYGVDTGRQVVIFHRWGSDNQGKLERFIIVLNFSPYGQWIDIPFSTNGEWEDLLSGWKVQINDWWLHNVCVSSNWGHIFFRKEP